MRLENTIEHILLQTPTDEYWTSRFDEEERRTLTHDLGNLCLTYHNSSYGNKPFPVKRRYPGQDGPCYTNSNLFQERKLSVLDNWNVEALKQRRGSMVKWALMRKRCSGNKKGRDPWRGGGLVHLREPENGAFTLGCQVHKDRRGTAAVDQAGACAIQTRSIAHDRDDSARTSKVML